MDRRISALLGEDSDVHVDNPAVDAAIYPQQVALTRLLASPGWSMLLLPEHPGNDPDTVPIGDLELEWVDAEITRRRLDANLTWAARERQLLRESVLLCNKPGTRQFASEVRRTVAANYTWPLQGRTSLSQLNIQHITLKTRSRDMWPAPALDRVLGEPVTWPAPHARPNLRHIDNHESH